MNKNCYEASMEFVRVCNEMEEVANQLEKASDKNDLKQIDILSQKMEVLDIRLHTLKRSLMNIEYKEI